MPKPTKKRRPVRGKDWHGWGLKDKGDGHLVVGFVRPFRSPKFPGFEWVKVKLVEVE
jgi:hypothetical protein